MKIRKHRNPYPTAAVFTIATMLLISPAGWAKSSIKEFNDVEVCFDKFFQIEYKQKNPESRKVFKHCKHELDAMKKQVEILKAQGVQIKEEDRIAIGVPPEKLGTKYRE